MGIVWDIVRNENKSKDFAKLLLEFDNVLGLDLVNSSKYIENEEKIELPEDVKALLEQRNEARKNKDWAESDRLRDEINKKGYIVKDTKDGSVVEKEF